jgi:hypothetical protein
MTAFGGGGGRSTHRRFVSTHFARKTSEVFSVDDVAVRKLPCVGIPPRAVPVVGTRRICVPVIPAIP